MVWRPRWLEWSELEKKKRRNKRKRKRRGRQKNNGELGYQ